MADDNKLLREEETCKRDNSALLYTMSAIVDIQTLLHAAQPEPAEPFLTTHLEPYLAAHPEPFLTAHLEPFHAAQPEPAEPSLTVHLEPFLTTQPEPFLAAQPEPFRVAQPRTFQTLVVWARW